MKINWKVRLKNPVFWLTVIPAVITFIYTVLGAFDVVPALSQDVVVNIVTAIITALTTIGVLIDPTTKGVGDSKRALEYDKPSDGMDE
uniref:Holin n=1 Tax=Siphoviridae sp. ct0uL16 TaxID=2825299 RepID=A0A8S5Q5C3_9CAUD|nr:MAG TPA: holin [Siphoviridae sp. ct0uL16]